MSRTRNTFKNLWASLICMLCIASVSCNVGCSTQTARERMDEVRFSGTKKSGPALDHFYIDSSFQPDRELTNKDDFFYKRCEFVRRNHFPSRSEYGCTTIEQ